MWGCGTGVAVIDLEVYVKGVGDDTLVVGSRAIRLDESCSRWKTFAIVSVEEDDGVVERLYYWVIKRVYRSDVDTSQYLPCSFAVTVVA